MDDPTYRIRDWNEHFETSESVKRVKSLTWVATPTKHDGKTFRRIMKKDPTGSMIGAWCLIVQVAAKCSTRGVLADKDGPLTAADISNKTGLSEDVVTMALEEFCSNEIRWMEVDRQQKNSSFTEEQDKTKQDKDNTLQDAGLPAGKSGIAAQETVNPARPAASPADSCNSLSPNEIGDAKKRRKFEKPTVDEIARYCAERENKIDAESFFDFYESKGWKVGSNPMADWKAAVRTWEKHQKSPAGGQSAKPTGKFYGQNMESDFGSIAVVR